MKLRRAISCLKQFVLIIFVLMVGNAYAGSGKVFWPLAGGFAAGALTTHFIKESKNNRRQQNYVVERPVIYERTVTTNGNGNGNGNGQELARLQDKVDQLQEERDELKETLFELKHELKTLQKAQSEKK